MSAVDAVARVAEVKATAFEIPTEEPESDGTLEWSSTTLVVVTAGADGMTGLGYTYAHQSCARLVNHKLADIVIGMPAMDVRAANTAMSREVRNLGATGVTSMAISAVDIALWDLKARLLGLPLVIALDAMHDAVPIYGSGGFTSYDDDQLRDQLGGWVEAGIPRVKMKIGRDPSRDPERLHCARKAVADDTELYVDANGAFSPRRAIESAHRLHSDFGVRWFEEPVTSDDPAGMQRVRDGAPGGVDVAAGEYLWAPWQASALFGAVDVLQVDVTRCLGITGFLAVASAAEVHQLDVSAHCAPQISAHAAAAVPRLRHLEYFHDHVRIESMLFDGVLELEPGGVLRPDRSRAGHGLTFKWSDADRFRVA
jgi:L-alanine-DL-glutamate epimerase-like enolase superfamily enzyme